MSSAAQISVVPSPAPSPDADTGALSQISAAVTPRRPLPERDANGRFVRAPH